MKVSQVGIMYNIFIFLPLFVVCVVRLLYCMCCLLFTRYTHSSQRVLTFSPPFGGLKNYIEKYCQI